LDQRLDLYDVRPGDTNFNWRGSVDEALSRLRSVPENAGRDSLWSAFPERTSSPSRVLNAELERAGGGNRAPVDYTFRISLEGDPLRLFEPTWDDEAPRPGDRVGVGRNNRGGLAAAATRSRRVGTRRLRDRLLTVAPTWMWEGSPDDAVQRLRGIPDGAGRDAVWRAFPDKVRAPEDVYLVVEGS
jgi:hypothetical protein